MIDKKKYFLLILLDREFLPLIRTIKTITNHVVSPEEESNRLNRKMDGIFHFLLNLNVILCPVLSASKELRNSIASLELEQNHQQPSFKVSALRLQMEEKGKPPYLEGYKEGPHSLISDSLFSLIIFIYVSVTFLYMFYAFCWRDEHPEQNKMQISQQTQDIDIDDSDEEGKIQVTAA